MMILTMVVVVVVTLNDDEGNGDDGCDDHDHDHDHGARSPHERTCPFPLPPPLPCSRAPTFRSSCPQLIIQGDNQANTDALNSCNTENISEPGERRTQSVTSAAQVLIATTVRDQRSMASV